MSEIRVAVDGRTGSVSFDQPMTNTYAEQSYARPKGPKVAQADGNRHSSPIVIATLRRR